MKLLIATHNPAKLGDYKSFAGGTGLEILSLAELGITEEFDEIFRTMEENAKGKAEFYYQLTKIPTLADDSGIEVPFWNMAPGVDTKPWANNNIDFITSKIKEIPEGQRQAQMRAVLAYCNGNQTRLEQGVIQGTLTDKVFQGSVTHGYTWDLVFIVADSNKYYEELTEPQYNHRKWAFDKLIPFITE